MYLSLTFKQEMLGKAATANNNGVKAEPGDNDHQDDINDDDDNDDGDGGGFAGSAGGSQSGATAELSLPVLLPMMAKRQLDAAAATMAIEESFQQDGGESLSYNADYNSFGPTQKWLFLMLLN